MPETEEQTEDQYRPPQVTQDDGKIVQFLYILNREAPGLLALLMVLTYCATIIFSIPVDDKFLWAISIILSFYFGSKRSG